MSSFNVYEYISYILINNGNTSLGKEPTTNNAFAGSGTGDSGGFSANQSKPWRHSENSYIYSANYQLSLEWTLDPKTKMQKLTTKTQFWEEKTTLIFYQSNKQTNNHLISAWQFDVEIIFS